MRRLAWVVLASALLAGSCGKSRQPVVVGSKTGTEQMLLGEIVAQLLERRLQSPVERRLALGGTEITHSALIGGQIGIYPEYTGTIGTVIRKETPSADSTIVLERARAEMLRVAQAELFGPLGFDSPPVAVVHRADNEKVDTLSQAAAGKTEWKIGVNFEFQQRTDGLTALNGYRLPMAASVRNVDPVQLFPSLEKKELTMIVVTANDGRLLSDKWKVLADDRKVFPPEQAVILARQDLLNEDPRIRAALSELPGKFSPETMRRLNAAVDVDRMPVAEVASGFLNSGGFR